jgi:hypothetical protein
MSAPDAPQSAPPPLKKPKRRLSGLIAGVRQAGRDAVSGAIGRLLGPVEPPNQPAETNQRNAANGAGQPAQRLGVLQSVTSQLRGAADEYLAAKLDEIEARVDDKLDHIEARIDRKIVELHQQLVELRDREVRHRLRLLKITLIFTVLVAMLSLGYKCASKYWFS